MKRVLAIVALIATLSVLAGCKKTDETPTIEFKDKLCTLTLNGTVELTVTLDKPAPANISIPVEFTSETAVMGTDYTLSAEAFEVTAGSTTASITITDNAMDGGSTVVAKLIASKDVYIGTNYTCVIIKDPDETVIYNFKSTEVELFEGEQLIIELTGKEQGTDFKAPKDLVIPFTIEGDGAKLIKIEGESAFVVKKGERTASVNISIDEDKVLSAPVNSSVKISSTDPRYVAGDNSTVNISVVGLQVPSKLLGTWNFSEVYDLEEMELWFMEYEDDPDLLPTHNEGFTLTFEEDENGNVTLTPGGTGDFLNYFRNATVTLSAPKNPCANAISFGKYTAKQDNMFRSECVSNPNVVFTYYSLSAANRAFSADDEDIASSVIAFHITADGDLEVQFSDYDCPPFGEMWWDDDFDADMFGFCSVFTKEQ